MKLRPFELVLLTTFLVLAVVAMMLLMFYQPEADPDDPAVIGAVEVWGSLPAEPMQNFLEEMTTVLPAFRQVEYRYVPTEEFDDTFIRALADDSPPDLLLIPHEALVTHRLRLEPVPPAIKNLRGYKDDYLDGAEVFTIGGQVYAVPIAVDPLLLYWNRSLLANVGLLGSPQTWEEFVGTTVPALTRREFDRSITQSAVAFGEARNVLHHYPVISMLAIQQGSQLVRESARGYDILLDATAATSGRPFSQALDFFMRFSDPVAPEYSWNRAQGLDRDEFLREELALYFGFASEATSLTERNPNLNFDVAEVPKGAAAPLRRTFGRFFGLALVRSSDNLEGAARIQQLLSDVGAGYATALATGYGMVPVTRAAVTAGTDDPYATAAYRAAPVARGWLAPGVVATEDVFAAIIEAAALDRMDVYGAADNGLLRLQMEY